MSRSFKIWVFLILVFVAGLAGAQVLLGRWGLLLGLLVSLSVILILHFFRETEILTLTEAQPLSGQDPWLLRDRVDRLCAIAGIPQPQIYILPTLASVSFAIGRSWEKSGIAVSVGLLQNLSERELEAVLAHQVARIRNLDTFLFGLVSTLGNAVIGLCRQMDKILFLGLGKNRPGMRPVSSFVSPILWVLMRLFIPQRIFLNCDLLAARLTHDPTDLAHALWRLEGLRLTQPLPIDPLFHHFFLLCPYRTPATVRWRTFQPRTEKRIRRLLGYYPI